MASTVTMKIQEYNDLRDELILYKRAVEEFCTPVVDSWSLEWYKEHNESSIEIRSNTLKDMSRDTKKIFSSIIKEKIEEAYGSIGDITIDSASMILADIHHYQGTARV